MKYEKEFFKKYRHALPMYKSKQYLRWVKERFPDYELHHILASVHGKKHTDYLVVPLTPEQHAKIQRYAAAFFYRYLGAAVILLLDYAKTELKLEVQYPETVTELVELLHRIHQADDEEGSQRYNEGGAT